MIKSFNYYSEILQFSLSSRKKQSILLLLLNFVSAFFEYFTLALIIPYTQVISDFHQGKINKPIVLIVNYFEILTPIQALYLITFCLLIFILISIFIRIYTSYYSNKFSTSLGVELSEKLLTNIIRQPYQYNLENNPNYSIATINIKGGQVVYGIIQPLLNLLTSSLLISAILLSLVWASWQTVIFLGIFFTLFYFSINRIFSNQISSNAKQIAEESGESLKILNEIFSGLRYVILNNSFSHFIDKYRKSNYKYLKSQGLNIVISSVPKYLLEGLMMIIVVLVLLVYFGTSSIKVELGTIILFVIGGQKLIPIVQQSFSYYNSLKGNIDALKDVLTALRMPIVSQSSEFHESTFNFKSKILFEDVSFSYPNRGNVLKSVSIEIVKGQKIGIVGVSGSGKSTLVDLILGLIEPTKGRILIDGNEFDPIFLQDWRRIIGSVPQTVIMNDQSIYENIAFGIPYSDINKKHVHYVAQKANILSEIESMEYGFDSIIGDKGAKLSGGQRQRIGIARALYNNPEILILDEATSALDHKTELEILDTIFKLDGITVIIVTHRENTLSRSNLVYRISSGKLSLTKND